MRYVTIIVHRDGDVGSRRLRVPLWAARAGTITLVAVAALALVAALVYAPVARTAARVPGLSREVMRLRAENDKVRALAAKLDTMEASYAKLQAMLGTDLVPPPPRSQAPPVAYPLYAAAPGRGSQAPSGATPPVLWPLDQRGVLTRGTVAAGLGGEEHSGLDVAVPVGTPIRASGGGLVVEAREHPEYGLFVRIRHAAGYESMYGHASRLLVESGDSVEAGQVIALSGSTGRSTAPHLHFEVRLDGRSVDPRTLMTEEH